MLLHVPHARTLIPDGIRDQLIPDDQRLGIELLRMTDRFTDAIAAVGSAHSRITPWSHVNGLSRLVIDPERFKDAQESMLERGMGAVYTRMSDGGHLRDESVFHLGSPMWDDLITHYFDPYALALQELVTERLAVHGHLTIIDVHSFPSAVLPYEGPGGGRRPEICIGADDFHSSEDLIGQARKAFAAWGAVLVNEPFSGSYVPMHQFQADRAVASMMIEIRRDLYMDESTGSQDADAVTRLGTTLATLIDAIEADSSG